MKKEYIETSGWDAITRAFEKLYPEQTDPLHYAPIISWRLGGEDPLDGISVYELKKASLKNIEEELNCICGILQTLGRITFENGDIFQPFEYIYTGQKTGMDSKSISNITGFVTVPD